MPFSGMTMPNPNRCGCHASTTLRCSINSKLHRPDDYNMHTNIPYIECVYIQRANICTIDTRIRTRTDTLHINDISGNATKPAMTFTRICCLTFCICTDHIAYYPMNVLTRIHSRTTPTARAVVAGRENNIETSHEHMCAHLCDKSVEHHLRTLTADESSHPTLSSSPMRMTAANAATANIYCTFNNNVTDAQVVLRCAHCVLMLWVCSKRICTHMHNLNATQ